MPIQTWDNVKILPSAISPGIPEEVHVIAWGYKTTEKTTTLRLQAASAISTPPSSKLAQKSAQKFCQTRSLAIIML